MLSNLARSVDCGPLKAAAGVSTPPRAGTRLVASKSSKAAASTMRGVATYPGSGPETRTVALVFVGSFAAATSAGVPTLP